MRPLSGQARVIGDNRSYNTNYGVKNNVVTEMFFRYVPAKDVTDGELYQVRPYFNTCKKTVSGRTFSVTVADRDLVTCDGNLLQNLDGKQVDFGVESVDVAVNAVPAQIVDTKGPVLTGHNIPMTWYNRLSSDTCLAFTDGGGFSYDGAQVSVVYYEGNTAHKVRIQANGAPVSGPGYLREHIVEDGFCVYAVDNGVLTVTVTDRFGKSDSLNVTVDTFDRAPPVITGYPVAQYPAAGALKSGTTAFFPSSNYRKRTPKSKEKSRNTHDS